MFARRENGTVLSKWNHAPTCTIRIPKVFKNEVLEYAKALDCDDDVSGKLALKLMNSYLRKECIDGREAARNYSSPRWYFFNKFKHWVMGNRE